MPPVDIRVATTLMIAATTRFPLSQATLDAMNKPACAHWNDVARAWHHWAPPLRPCHEDTAVLERVMEQHRTSVQSAEFKVLLWGVTPEIAEMSWPNGTGLLAVDRAPEMVKSIWPGDIEGRRRAHCAQWSEYPTVQNEFDAVVGDGVFTAMNYPHECRERIVQAQWMLKEDGILVSRLFVLPETPEPPSAVFEDLHAGRIGNFHIFKFRLAMSLQTSAASGVRLGDVYEAWSKSQINVQALATATGWTSEAIHTIEHYRDKDTRLNYTTLREFKDLVAPLFETIDYQFPNYEMGDRCPTVVCRARR